MPTVYNLGQIAEDIYENTSRFRAAQGISRVRNTTDTSISGFKAAVYTCGGAGVLAFCGSDDLGDVAQDLALFSLYKPQFIQAVHFASRAVRMRGLEPQHTFLTGHSLGGALAKFAAWKMTQGGFPPAATYSFNGPNLTPGLRTGMATLVAFRHIDVNRPLSAEAGGKVVNIRLDGDWVSNMGVHLGHSITLPPPSGVRGPVACHSMSNVNRVLANGRLGSQDAWRHAVGLGRAQRSIWDWL